MSPLTRLKTLLNITLDLASTATEEALNNVIPQLENIVELLRKNQINRETSTLNFPKLALDQQSHKNL